MEGKNPHPGVVETLDVEEGFSKPAVWTDGDGQNAGVARIEAMKIVQGRTGRWAMWIGVVVMLTYYQFDNALLYNYRTYAASTFNQISLIATLNTAATIVFAVTKPPIAKLSNVFGRGETYLFCALCYIIGYIMCASSSSFGVYAGSVIISQVGQTGFNILNDTIIADITSMRKRALALSLIFTPFLITPWISGIIVQDVVRPGGIGWRWGVGMFAIILPVCVPILVGPMLYYQRKARKKNIVLTEKMTPLQLASQIDLVGSFLLVAGFGMFLIPFSLAGSTPSKWSTGWIIALIVLGAACIGLLLVYEGKVAAHPILPPRYFTSLTIIICSVIGGLDAFGVGVTHTYLYTWATVARGFGPRDATYFTYVNGVVSAFVSIIGGLIVMKYRRYKWLLVLGSGVRLIGYGLMIRLRGANNSVVELYIVQAVQGAGSGLIDILIVVAAQIVVPHAELAQVTSFVLLLSFIGSSISSAVAGGIYSGTFKSALRNHLGPSVSESTIDQIFNSITQGIPPAGSTERQQVSAAYSDVLRYMTYAALGVAVLIFVLSFFVPSHELKDGHNLADDDDAMAKEHVTHAVK
ncbi:hypothetical protein M409DRAFT_37019 [Zasmidium cellare ATCC 36951]|uniref:Major facilitator superfamily (MFS) profile domain-containing protein n=1 Tax=Zasmidium cellare ATCC 36951 TaxID=1080233 RepID=A0A6A6CCU5_ZASCE|nr:uncharacterized protein M409DRAFT_37019 [Zasmidium cellare ATCC 36951]KAF2164861.1 hypothetical protein M409DRAFT_37019 [Zasmidium cellare ATCC 36951]